MSKKYRKQLKISKSYHPPVISAPSTVNVERPGTTLILSSLKKRINTSLDKNLRKRVARRFSIFSKDFQVFIDNEEITLGDRSYFEKLEYALVYGDYDKLRFKHDGKYVISRPDNTEEGSKTCSVRGWIGLVKESGSLQEGADNLNKISVLARGKVALEDILDTFREGGMYTKYVIGELTADFLDLTNEDDIATSSRQDFIQSDPRFIQLREFVKQELKFLAKGRVRLKNAQGTKRAQEIPAIKEWYGSLENDPKKAAEKLFGKINQIATDEEHRKTLYKHGVLAFEHLQHKEKLNDLEKIDINNLDITVELFSELDDIEASWYYQITEGRLDVIRKLNECVDENVLEKIIQKHIHDHLWLLDPSWDRATETPFMEQTVIKAFRKISNKLTEEEKNGRLDIRYKKTSGKHVVVELKRASVKVSGLDIMKQVEKYTEALRKQLKVANEQGSVEAICLVGKEPENWSDPEARQRIRKNLSSWRRQSHYLSAAY